MLRPTVRVITGTLIVAAALLAPAFVQPASAATFASEQLWGTTSDNNWEPAVATDPAPVTCTR